MFQFKNMDMANTLKIGYLEAKLTESQKCILIIDEDVNWFFYKPIPPILYNELNIIFGKISFDVIVDGEKTTSKTTVIVDNKIINQLENAIICYLEKIYFRELRNKIPSKQSIFSNIIQKLIGTSLERKSLIDKKVPISEQLKEILRVIAILMEAVDVCSSKPHKITNDAIDRLLILTVDF
jgi:hypothetical protein